MIRIRKPQYAYQFIGKPVNYYGVMPFIYKDDHSWVMPTAEEPADPYVVQKTIRELQDVIPLAKLGDYEVFCLNVNVLVGVTPDMGVAEAQATNDYLAISAGATWGYKDLLSHEISHKLAKLLTPDEEAEFWRIVGQERGSDNAFDWADLPAERFAEYLSTACYGVPLREGVTELDDATLAKVREWALRKFGGGERADVIVDVVKVTVGSKEVTVNDKTFIYDVAPLKVDPPGRVMVPVRLISEAIGAEVTWDEKTQTVTIRK